jgi:FKBP-type peptidyl-prolyl cis-trans isomerase 2
MKIAPGSIVRIEYEIRVKGGDVVESSTKSGPVQYVHGDGKLLPALEKRLEGMATGETREGEIPASEAIPPEETLPTRVIARSEFPSDGPLDIGSLFEAHAVGGAVIDLRIVSVDEKFVTARLLPPLVGKDLVFKVRVMRIEDPVSHLVSVVRKPPPPLNAKVVSLDVEPDED